MKKQFRVLSVFDTETCNVLENGAHVAYPILYIFNDLREKQDLSRYETEGDDVRFYRLASGALEYLKGLVSYGLGNDVVPVVCAYNLMFDLQSLIYPLNAKYPMRVIARSSTNVYTLDLMGGDGEPVLRFWDTFFLEQGGLATMGKTAGLPKAVGDWDYSKTRTPDTPLTERELFYAARDVQVIPAYLRYLLESNEWLEQADLGCRVLTKTSLVRRMALNEIGGLRFRTRKGTQVSLQTGMEKLCEWEQPPDYETYALRKACFRGGFTFTAGRYAGQVQRDVVSLDETSAHHAFLNGRFVPRKFRKASPDAITAAARAVTTTPLGYVFRNYAKPFSFCMHALISFENVRLRHGSAFEHYEIGLLSESKFAKKLAMGEEAAYLNEAEVASLEALRASGYSDSAEGAVYAYGKLMSAKRALVFVTETELYAMACVYEWDDMRGIAGELSVSLVRPPDYVTLQSNILFERKQDMKRITKSYMPGVSYSLGIPDSIPEGIANGLRKGELTNAFVRGYYTSTVKGQFNGIYGTQAQDVVRPEFEVEDGCVRVDRSTTPCADNYDELLPDKSRVLYTYGMRIVGGSRLHLVLAIMLLWRAFGSRVRVLGGDTDSLKVSAPDVTDSEILGALAPLHDAISSAIEYTQKRVRENYPDKASGLEGVGCFEIEEVEGRADGCTRYPLHMELWNKARVSFDGARVHVTCAGLPRPENRYTIEDAISSLMRTHTFARSVELAMSYNVTVSPTIANYLQDARPAPGETESAEITDYRGVTSTVHTPRAVALYEAPRVLGDTSSLVNWQNVCWQQNHGREVFDQPRRLEVDNVGNAYVVYCEEIYSEDVKEF